ncbi:MAG: hypothetical protein EA350_14780 [Gemmatimonadales bacterium]|nr:MAG: hypothetical protein EA350_14780 [Gemmatimonadales bacterium]
MIDEGIPRALLGRVPEFPPDFPQLDFFLQVSSQVRLTISERAPKSGHVVDLDHPRALLGLRVRLTILHELLILGPVE